MRLCPGYDVASKEIEGGRPGAELLIDVLHCHSVVHPDYNQVTLKRSSKDLEGVPDPLKLRPNERHRSLHHRPETLGSEVPQYCPPAQAAGTGDEDKRTRGVSDRRGKPRYREGGCNHVS
ncbi:hypothetical protein NDU88_006459 [Pleurodeles waltl]|uniref:Uncharacterized protein n=1 Tax=Pleurodeles waltl TaxID=8319 RepID=A0AAV7WAM6_PLEWA|nr:hypothetical protein NDU88_006459 [Pleurodeles waltl]